MSDDKTSKDKTEVFTVDTVWDTFISPNGLKMLKGDKFNWRIEKNDQSFVIECVNFIKDVTYYTCAWYPKTKMLFLLITSTNCNSDNVISFSTSFEMAEVIVECFIKANNVELVPLHKKENNV